MRSAKPPLRLPGPQWLGVILGALLVLVAALCYLPLTNQLGFYNDDWYLLYVHASQGAAGMLSVFEIDRPFRGYVVGWLFELFGTCSWLYSLSAFALRAAGALGVWWLLRRLWPAGATATYLGALLFAVYPGFLDQPNALDFQSHQIAFVLEIFSILFSVQAMYSSRRWVKALLLLGATFLALGSFSLMEYYIGLEGLRFFSLLLIAWRQENRRLLPGLRRAVLYDLPLLLVSAGFLYWRIRIFGNARAATDIVSMAVDLSASPVLRGLWMIIYLVQDVLNVLFVAWAEPLYRLAFTLRLKHIMLVATLGVAAMVVAWIANSLAGRMASHQEEPLQKGGAAREMILLGLLGVSCALVPVHFGSRHVLFESFSRFTLTASVGAAFLLTGVGLLFGPRLRCILVVGLVGLAAMTHTANAIHYAENWQLVRSFWWQVAWRIPQIEPGTVLVASYADQGIAEDYFVWGPANLIYYPYLEAQDPITLTVTAVTINQADLLNVFRGSTVETLRRGIFSQKDPARLLVLSMPTPYACVHVLDGSSLELSDQDRPEIRLLAPYSQMAQIRLNEGSLIPPAAIFGAPPAQDWCFYYQQASLARQRGDWQTVASLGDEALAHGFRPYDWIEWMPFAQGYAYTGQYDKLRDIAAVLRTNLYYRYETCQLVNGNGDAQNYPEGHQQLVDQLCQGK